MAVLGVEVMRQPSLGVSEALTRLARVSMGAAGGGGGGGGGPASAASTSRRRRGSTPQAPEIPDLGRRVVALFRPYRGRLVVTGFLVVVGAAIAVIPPLIVQRIFDDALFPVDGGPPDIPLLWRLVVVDDRAVPPLRGRSASCRPGSPSTVGNQVTGDLRVRLFEHLQAMELGFFTRTKTGVIQSRLQNDVGGVVGRAHEHRHEHPRQPRDGRSPRSSR